MKHKLSKTEYNNIKKSLGRAPNALEISLCAALWNEHCSYKSTKHLLQKLYYARGDILNSFGDNAGAIDIGDGQALIFKIESHNHPSYLEPYHGAATGVGGILRDIFVMGAKPIALLNSLRFGNIDNSHTSYFTEKVSAGIAAYSNSFGVATIGGEVEFDPSYDKNILVNVCAAGLVEKHKLLTTKVDRAGFSLYYMGAATDNDGCGASIMASQKLEKSTSNKHMQIARPFLGRCCYEAFQELLKEDVILASTDLGASGLACAITELAIKNQVGLTLNLNNVPIKKNLKAEEILFSETQERILVVLKPGMINLAKEICAKWQIEFAAIAHTIATNAVIINYNDKAIAQFPIHTKQPQIRHKYAIAKPTKDKNKSLEDKYILSSLTKILSLPNIASKAWFYEQFDQFIQGNHIYSPLAPCALITLEEGKKALAFHIDAKPSYVNSNAYYGTQYSIIKGWRALSAVGAKALAVTNNLNFGSPEIPNIMGSIISATKALAKTSKILNMPVISGNVSLYNQTGADAIKPTIVIASVGIINDYYRNPIKEKDLIFIIGGYPQNLYSSILWQLYPLIQPYPPKFSLKRELAYGSCIKNLINKRLIKHSLPMGAGGLLTILAKVAIKAKLGMKLNLGKNNLFTKCFSEEKPAYVIFIAPENEDKFKQACQKAMIKTQKIGLMGGSEFSLAKIFNVDINTLAYNFETGIPHGLKRK